MIFLWVVLSESRAGGGALTELQPSRLGAVQRSESGIVESIGNRFRGLLSPSSDVGVRIDARDGDSELWLSSCDGTPKVGVVHDGILRT